MKQDTRSIQTMSTNLYPNERKQQRAKLDQTIAEINDKSQVKWKDVKDFFSFSYGFCGMICLFVICLITAITQLLPSLWLVWWLEKSEEE